VFINTIDFLDTLGQYALVSKSKIPVAILVRVSTMKQETDRQVSELSAYADSKGYEVIEICREQVSGMADESDRHGLNRAEELARSTKSLAWLEGIVLPMRSLKASNSVESLCIGISKEWKPSFPTGGEIQRLLSCSPF